ncbi:SusC/RagA family TonB-linked outer membrane protein [Ohtaekwangia kribbensis]|uniref:SusC/RagA family TonB-linked outer membrane protein n=1 Tax=Ohtaekwangia kribbensis TaxID=688913 RepID=A0ABW3K734_9BACT
MVFLSVPVCLYASPLQAVTVTGTVIDDTGEILPGVSVVEKGTTNGTVSDSNGNFKLTVSSSQSVVVFSFVGTVSQEIIVGERTVLNVTLVADASTLSEVVVVGYGTQDKKDVTGAIASVKSEDFNRGIMNSPEQLLQGKVAGVNVTSVSGEPGARQTISIRGPGGVRTGSTPLFVVDGIPLDNSSTGGDTNPLNFLNPQDIETMDVLKDASATAIYGSRGANGVVLITTKRGKAGHANLSYHVDYGISKLARKIDVFTADEFRQHVPETGATIIDAGSSTDWQKEVMRTAYTKNHNLNLSGGSDNLTYYASLGMQDQEGILKESNMKRYTGRINLTQELLNDKLKVELNLSASNTENNRPPVGDIIGTALSMNPTYAAYDDAGNPTIIPNVTNPLIRLKLNDDITSTTRIIGNISPSLEIIKGLVYKLNFGIDNSSSIRDEQALPSTTPQQDGRLNSTFVNNNNNLIENYITYAFTKGQHNVSLLAGHSYQKIFLQTRWWSISKFPDNGIEPRYNPGLGTEVLLTGDNNNKPYGTATKNELQSFFGRINYEFKDRYLITATVRADGSSKFGSNNKYGTFPSFALGWRISEESFMESLPFSNLKLRAGWGQTGNQEIPSKITQARFSTTVGSSTSYPLNPTGAYPAGTTYSRLANPNIQWEVSQQTNIGLDYGFFEGALSGSIDYFNKVSDNILLEVVPPDPIQPAPTYWTNVKSMEITNKGWELALNYQNRGNGDFTYGIGGNITFIDNVVEGSPYTIITTGTINGAGLTSATANGYVNGQPIGTFYLKDFAGIDENGENVFVDHTGDGEITDADRISAGSALPKKMYNFTGNIGYKGFDLSINFNGVSGNKVYDNTENALFTRTNLSRSFNTTSAAIEYPQESDLNSGDVSTRYLKNGSFLRLNNATFGYNFRPEMLGLSNWVKSLRLSVTGQNLFVITGYDGYDPEVNTDKTVNGITSWGIDYQSYPKARTIVFGLNITF